MLATFGSHGLGGRDTTASLVQPVWDFPEDHCTSHMHSRSYAWAAPSIQACQIGRRGAAWACPRTFTQSARLCICLQGTWHFKLWTKLLKGKGVYYDSIDNVDMV